MAARASQVGGASAPAAAPSRTAPRRPRSRSRLRRLLRPPRRLRFTREGKYYVAITVGIGFAAINTGNNLLYLLLGWLLSTIIASGILSELSLRGLRVVRRPPARVFARRPFLMGIDLENRKGRLPSFSIEVEDLVDDRPLDKKCYFLKIPARREQTTSYRHVFARRGPVRFDGLRLSTKFPFALFRKSLDVDLEGEVLVFPAVHPVAIPAPAPDVFGEDPRARLGRSGDYLGLRDFRHGDDHRDVHWRTSAHHGRLLVRELEDESRRRAVILVDNALPPGAGAAAEEGLERAISLAASLANAYLGRQYAVRLVARGAHVPSGAGPHQLTRVLRTLALLEAVPPGAPFAGAGDGGAENVLVTHAGAAAGGARPAGVSRVVEVPA